MWASRANVILWTLFCVKERRRWVEVIHEQDRWTNKRADQPHAVNFIEHSSQQTVVKHKKQKEIQGGKTQVSGLQARKDASRGNSCWVVSRWWRNRHCQWWKKEGVLNSGISHWVVSRWWRNKHRQGWKMEGVLTVASVTEWYSDGGVTDTVKGEKRRVF